jgi:hypothetical protein
MRRLRRRGAALIEAVVCLPILVLLLAAILYVGRLYSARISALAEVRAAVWKASLGGCPGRSGGFGFRIPDAVLRRAPAAGGAEVVRRSGSARARGTVRVDGDAVLGRSPELEEVEAEIPCNETPQEGNVAGVIDLGWRQARFW